jgi:DNA-binding SARP family transcriptional activator
MEFRILGPLEVRDDGRLLELGGAKQRALLAVLVLHANRPVTAEHLADALWGEDAAGRAVKTIQVYVSRLRGSLGEGEALLTTTLAGYQLRVRPGELDAERFERLVRRGQDALSGGRPELAAGTLREALALWNGPPLADFAFASFAQAEIARLEEIRLAALETRIEADLAVGRHAQLIPELQQLCFEHPTRERLAAHLVVALYRCGRQADALATYRATRARLVDEHGIEPGRELRELEQQVLVNDPALELGPAQAALQEAPVATALVVAEPEPEEALPLTRRTVTVVVATLRFEPGAAQPDPELARRLIKRGRDEAIRVIVGRGGRFQRGLGAELVGVFGLETINEDDALRALEAAVELRERITALLEQQPGDARLRIGVDTGEVVIEEPADEPALFGDPLDGALALARAAQDNVILLTERTRGLAPDAIRVDPVDALTWRLADVIPNAPAVLRRHSTPMVGRDEDLATLLAGFARTTRTRRARMQTVFGEAGLGKSRLAHEFRTRVADEATVLVAYCRAYGAGGSLWPLGEAVAELAGGTSREAIRRLLGDVEEADAITDLAMAGLGLADPPVDKEAVPWALRRLLGTIAERRPLVLIVEDIHAAEQQLLEQLQHLVEWLSTTPMFVLSLARPEFRDTRGDWIGGHAGMPDLELEKLEPDAAARMLENLIDEHDVELARDQVLSTAEGNPLFIEQIYAMRREQPDSRRAIPATINALLAARLDRLSAGERVVIQHAAVIGRRFGADAVVELVPAAVRPAAAQHLRELVHRGLITPDRSPFAGEELLCFDHILIRDEAYNTLTKEERGRLHERYANALEQDERRDRPRVLRASGENIDEAIGFHLERAFAYRSELVPLDAIGRELAGRAGDRLGAAGRRTLARGHWIAATGLLERAIELLRTADQVRPEILLALGSAQCDLGDWMQAGTTLRDAFDAAREAKLRTIEAHAMVALSHQRLFADAEPDLQAMRRTADTALAIFAREGDDSGLARAWNHIGVLHWGRLEIEQLEDALLRALEHAETVDDARARGEAYNTYLRAAVVGPCTVAEGIRRCELARANAGDLASIGAVADATQAVFEAMRSDIDRARDLYRGARARLEEFGLTARLAGLQIYPAMVELIAGDPRVVEPVLARACALLERIGESGRLATAIAMLARVREALGAREDALALTRRSEDLSYAYDTSSHILWAGTRARLLAHLGELDEAERYARMSVTIARRTSAEYLTAGALTDLAEVLVATGDRVAALAVLDEAIALHAAKQNVASARSVRERRASV